MNDRHANDARREPPDGIVSAGKFLVRQSMRDDVMGLSAELSYRFFLALFPFAIFLAALGGFVAAQLPIENPAEQAVEVLGDALPDEAAVIVQGELENIIETQNPGLLSIGAILALFFATGGTNAVIKAMDRVYGVRETRSIWKRYLVSLFMTVIAGAALIAAFMLIVPLRIFGPQIAEALGLGENAPLLMTVLGGVVAFALLLLTAAYVYRMAPNIQLPLRSVLPGALLFAVAWIVGTIGFFLWVTMFGDYSTTYGALAGVVIMLIWFYVSALIFLLGAEFNEVLHEWRDSADVENRRRASEAADDGRAKGETARGEARRTSRREPAEDDTEEGASAA